MDSSGCTTGRINSVTRRDFDLAVGTIKYSPCPVQEGGSVTISASILNHGVSVSGPAMVVFFADKNRNGICEEDEEVDSTGIPGIVMDDSIVINFNYR